MAVTAAWAWVRPPDEERLQRFVTAMVDLVLQGVIVRRYVVSAGHGLIAGRGDRTDPRLAPAVGRGHLVGPGGVALAVRRLPNQ